MVFPIKSCVELYLEGATSDAARYFTTRLKKLGNPDVPVLMSITETQVNNIGDDRIRNDGFNLFATTRNPTTGRIIHHYVRLPDQ